MATKVLERIESDAGRAVRRQASSSVASLSRVSRRDDQDGDRLTIRIAEGGAAGAHEGERKDQK
jgi:hypothetical protein